RHADWQGVRGAPRRRGPQAAGRRGAARRHHGRTRQLRQRHPVGEVVVTHEEILGKLRERFGADAFAASTFRDNRRVIVPAANAFAVLEFLKQSCDFDMLAELSAADYLHYPDAKDRYGVWYVLLNTSTGVRLVVKTFVNDPEPALPTVFGLWKGADWME